MTQFQTNKNDIHQTRIVELDEAALQPGNGEILVRIDKFGFSTNNITYAVAGETLGYWQFFKPAGEDPDGWGIVPVWGFGEVTRSNHSQIPQGERLFGYFPPASHLIMAPTDATQSHFLDATPHRAELPKGYNVYRRVAADPTYNSTGDDMQMLFFPLYATSFALWDTLKENNWYGAEQVIIVSASSKTSIGLAYAINSDPEKPDCIGLTSPRNLDFVNELGVYDEGIAYDCVARQVADIPTAIVDMSGNGEILGQIHAHLGDNMVKTLNVGLTHWDSARRDDRIIRDRSEFFFAPSQIQKRMKERGADEFGKRSAAFIMDAAIKSNAWLKLKPLEGINGLDGIYAGMVDGKSDPRDGYTITL